MTNFSKATCGSCKTNIEFDPSQLQYSQQYFPCPCCGKMVLLLAPPPNIKANETKRLIKIFAVITASCFVFSILVVGAAIASKFMPKTPYGRGESCGSGRCAIDFGMISPSTNYLTPIQAKSVFTNEDDFAEFKRGFQHGYSTQRAAIKSAVRSTMESYDKYYDEDGDPR